MPYQPMATQIGTLSTIFGLSFTSSFSGFTLLQYWKLCLVFFLARCAWHSPIVWVFMRRNHWSLVFANSNLFARCWEWIHFVTEFVWEEMQVCRQDAKHWSVVHACFHWEMTNGLHGLGAFSSSEQSSFYHCVIYSHCTQFQCGKLCNSSVNCSWI